MEKIRELERGEEEKEITSFVLDVKTKEILWDLADFNNCSLSDIIRYGLKTFLSTIEK